MDGDIEQGGLCVDQLGGQLVPAGDLNGQTGDALGTGIIRDGGGSAHRLILPAGPEGGELIQHLPAHGIDGGGRDGEAGVHMGADFGAAVGGSAGFGQPLGQRGASQRHTAGQFRNGTGYLTGSALGVRDTDAAAIHADNTPEGDVHQLGLSILVGIPCGLQPFGILPLVLPGAEHLAVDTVCIIAVGKALTVEGGEQRILHALSNSTVVQRLAVDRGDGGHILGPLHASLQLDGGDTHFLQLLQVMDQTVVFQAQGVFLLPVVVAVALAAGLGAASPVAGAAADGGGHIALAAVAHAQGAVDKYFNFNGGVGADIADLLPVQLPAEHHTFDTHGGAHLHTGKGVDGHLRGAVDGNVGGDLTAQLHDAKVLNNECVHIAGSSVADHLRQGIDLLVGNQGIQRQVDIHTPDMAVLYCLLQGLGGKILCALTGIKGAAAQIYGVCSVLYGCPKGIHGASRCQQFDHSLFLQYFSIMVYLCAL